jgi:hypothetical protein
MYSCIGAKSVFFCMLCYGRNWTKTKCIRGIININVDARASRVGVSQLEAAEFRLNYTADAQIQKVHVVCCLTN